MDWPVYQLLTSAPAVTSVIGAGSNAKIFKDIAPQEVVPPYVTYGTVGGSGPLNYLGEAPAMDRGRVQVDCFSRSRPEVVDLAKAVRAALEADAYMISTPRSLYETATKLYRFILEFEFHTSR